MVIDLYPSVSKIASILVYHWVPEGPNVYRTPPSIRFFAPEERDAWFDAFIYQYIALRWSATQGLAGKSINIFGSSGARTARTALKESVGNQKM
jgi:hypothetical protein